MSPTSNSRARLSEKEQSRLTRYLALARQLGAEVISTPGVDVAETLLRVARQHNVTQIVIGKPLGPRWNFWKRDPLRWLMLHSGNIDIHMIPAEESAQPRREPIDERLARVPWQDFGIALAIVVAVTGFSLSIFDYTGYWAVAFFYLLAVVFAATRLRRWPTFIPRRTQCPALGFFIHSAALHLLHQSPPRFPDVRRLLRDRHCYRSSRQ